MKRAYHQGEEIIRIGEEAKQERSSMRGDAVVSRSVMRKSFRELFSLASIDFNDNAGATCWTDIFINAGRQDEVVPSSFLPMVASTPRGEAHPWLGSTQ
jgi:hypothetical protein